MSERGHTRGGGRGRGGRGGGAGNRGGAHQGSQAEKPKKENILDLNKYINKEVNVKFNGGRESKLPKRSRDEISLTESPVIGTLKGYDQLMNLTLDDARETMRDGEGNEKTRSLGLLVARGTLLVLLSPVDGTEEIANPFAPAEE